MDKRKFPRYEKNLTMGYFCTDKTAEAGLPGRILNISLGGVYMLSDSIIEKDTSITMTFKIKKDGDIKNLTTTGSVLRSGIINDNPEIISKYNLKKPDDRCFAVVKFEAPFIELSFMLY